VEFRRPSTIRLYNHQWEWAGFGNYSKAMPSVQGDMSEFNKFTYYFTSAAGGRVTPKGSNEDGFEVTPKGLEDIATGATISAESLGGQGIDESQQTDFPNGIQVGGTASLADVTISGTTTFSSESQAKTSRTGAVRLASFAQLTATGGAIVVAASDAELDAAPEAVTIGGLNRWRQTQGLISGVAAGTARQLYQTNAAGTAAEWTSNVDIPGTLDVTGLATFDGKVSFPLGTALLPTLYPGTDTNTGLWSPGADTLAISNNGAETLRTDSAGRLLVGVTTANANGGVLQLKSGITFPAADVASTDVNTLDDYEEGTWTPVVIGDITAGAATYSTVEGKGRYGTYIKIGALVYITGRVYWTAHTGSGGIRITGFPFVTAGSSEVPIPTFYADFSITGMPMLFFVDSNRTAIPYAMTSTGATPTQMTIEADGGFTFAFTYRI
jgi:hypothetical protein